MTMRGFETVGVRAVIQGLPEYLAGAKAITNANVGISGSLNGLSSVTNGFKLLAAAAAGVTAVIGGAAISSAVKYETTLAKIDALTNTSAEDTERLGKGLLNLAKTVPKSPNELGAAAYFALSSGITDVDDALKLVTAASKASAAGLGSTADIVDIVTAAVNAYGPANLDAAKAVDILVATVREGKGEPAQMATALGTLLPLAAALKIPFEDLAATFASLTNALGGGGAAEQAATQLRGILSQIASPSREAKNALAEAEAGIKHLSQEELDLADAHRSVVSASDNLESAYRGIRDAGEGVVQAQRGVRDANQGVEAAHRSAVSATEALRNAYADLTQAQRNQQQASLDGRRETLSVLEAEQGLTELRTQQGSHAQEVAAAELALAQARETASAKGKKTALEQRSADLAVSQAELRLNTVRSQGGRYALDLQNAELRLADARARVGTAQKQQDKDVADRQKNIQKATQDVTDAHRAETKAREGVTDATKNLNKAYEGVTDAQKNAARAGSDLALAQEKELLAQIHTRDAYSDLRKEIAEKGLIPTLQRLNDLFVGNQEGLAKLFPDVRGFIGFLSAITSQGAATASILDRIKGAAGITDEAFKRMSETTAFQAGLLKNQFNVALIELGSAALPLVNAGLLQVIKYIPQISDFFKKGLSGAQIGGDLNKIERAAFDAGEKIRGLIDFIKQNKDNSLLPAGKSFLEGLQTVAQWFIDHKEAIAAAFFLFAATNPIWAGILAGGVIITAIGVMGQEIDKLSDPFLRVRREIDKTIIRMADFSNTFLSLGLNKVPGLKELVPTVVSAKGAEQDLAAVEAELKRRADANNKAAEAARQLKQDQELALAAGVPYVEFLKSQITQYIAAGGTKMDEFLQRVLRQYEALPGSDKDFIANTRAGLQEAAPAALALANNLALVNPPNVGDAGRSQLDAATEASLNLSGSIDVIRPPNTGDGGEKALEDATVAATGEKLVIDSIKPPNIADAGKLAIDLATRAAQAESNILAGIRRPNVGDAGLGAIAAAATSAWSLASALGTAAANAIRVGSGLGSALGTRARAEGGVVRAPEFAIIGEAGPEAILPLTDVARSREIMSQLSPGFVAAMMPKGLEDGGAFGYSAPIAGKRQVTAWDLYEQYFGHWQRPKPGLFQASGPGGGGDSGSAPIAGGGGYNSYDSSYPTTPTSGGSEPTSSSFAAPKQIYATLPPSLVRMITSASSRPNGITINELFGGDVNIGSTSREIEQVAVSTVRALFSQARAQTAIGGGLVTSGIG